MWGVGTRCSSAKMKCVRVMGAPVLVVAEGALETGEADEAEAMRRGGWVAHATPQLANPLFYSFGGTSSSSTRPPM